MLKLPCTLLLLCLSSWGVSVKLETLKYCCGLGTNYADSGLKCSSFQTPIAGIQKEDEKACLNSIVVCCKNEYKTLHCNAGKEDAKMGKGCTSTAALDGDDIKKECCEACVLGRETGDTGQPCENSLNLFPPYDTTFVDCCKEVKPTTTTTTTTLTTSTNTTTVRPALTTPSKITSSTTVKQTTPNKINSNDEPPFENPCDIGDICAQICIPTPDSYKCDCYKGYALMADGISCRPEKKQSGHVDRCQLNNPCDQDCIDTGVAIKCSCNDGFELAADKRTCNDIDECALKLHDCAKNEVCVNGEGYYYCEDPNDTDGDASDVALQKCPEGYTFNGENMVCDDINECDIEISCPRPKVCVNTIGSFTCEGEDTPQCPPGFYYKPATGSCEDIDECVTAQDDCNRESQTCLNTKGNFTCIDKVSKKICPPGFKKNPYTQQCEDINECEEIENVCAANEECINDPGGHTCAIKVSKVPLITYPTSTTPLVATTEVSSSLAPSSTTPMSSTTRSTPEVPPPPPTLPQKPLSPRYFPHQPPNVTRQTHSVNKYFPATQATVPIFFDSRSNLPFKCPYGFEHSRETNRCEDINECVQSPCDIGQDCYNIQGSYVCRCKQGFTKEFVTNACVDINECQLGSHDCGEGQRCDNTIGSFICSRITSCGTGYTLNYASGLCEDDDECALGTHTCNKLGDEYQCRNTAGSYRCERARCRDCFVSRVFTSSTRYTPKVEPTRSYPIISGVQRINCFPGYSRNANGECEDINECASNPCRKGERCENLSGKFRCIPRIQCTVGYELNEDGNSCIDINECVRGLHKCKPSQICKNGQGYYTCQCPPGHQPNAMTGDCEDIDECRLFRGRVCSIHADCKNTIGSYTCECKDGYEKKEDTCQDIDECVQTSGLCEQNCVNIWGSYRCSCKPGFTLNSDNRTCTDIDECEKFKDSKLCIGTCQNTPGSYTCTCPQGYTLSSDERGCQDIDECSQHACSVQDICVNTRGGYKCKEIKCPAGYIRDPDHKSRCKRASNVCDPRNVECLLQPGHYSYHFITLVSNLPITQRSIPFFTMKGPDWNIATADFKMELVRVECPYYVKKVDDSYFYMNRFRNGIQLSLVKSIEGPQEVEIKVEMSLYVQGSFNGILAANIYLIVSEYQF